MYSFTNHQIIVWVLAPLLLSNDANIDYYDFSQKLGLCESVFAELVIEWQFQPLTRKDYTDVIETMQEKDFAHKTPVVFNLCYGDEVNGTRYFEIIKPPTDVF